MARGGGEEIVVVPEGWLSRGEAFVRGEGRQLVIFGGIPGERARVRLIERGQHQTRARFVRPQGGASPDRVEPACDRYAPCGRCPWMHLSEAGQDRARRALLADALVEAGVSVADNRGVEPVLRTAGTAMHSVELFAGWSDDRHLRIGVPARDGRRLVAIPSCTLATDSLRTLMTATAHHARVLEVWPWEDGRGSLRGVFARQSSTTGELLVTFVFARPSPYGKALAEAIAGQQAEVAGAFVHWNETPGPLLAPHPETGDLEASLVYGRSSIEEEVGGLRLRLGALDPFPQFPTAGARSWVEAVRLLAPQKGDTVVDIGSGLGARTLLLAREAGWALGIDPRDALVRRARDNATLNGVSADFVPSNLAIGLEDAQERLQGRRPLAVLDAGPKGVDAPTMDALLAVDPRRILLVSTNTRALARDAGRFVARGFRLSRVVPVDTLPNATYSDTLALLESPDASPPALRAPRRRTVR